MISGFPFFDWSWFFFSFLLGPTRPSHLGFIFVNCFPPKIPCLCFYFFHKLGDLGTPSPQVWTPQSFLNLSFVLWTAITTLFHHGPHLTASHFYRSIWMKIPTVPLLQGRHWLDFITIPSLFFLIYNGYWYVENTRTLSLWKSGQFVSSNVIKLFNNWHEEQK